MLKKTSQSYAAPRILVLASLSPSLIYFRGEMLKALIARGYEVHAAGPDMEAETMQKLQAIGCIPHQVKLQRTGQNPVLDLISLISLFRLMRKVKPAIFLGYTIKPVIYGTLAAWLARVPRRCALITGLGFSFTAEEVGMNGIVMKMARALYKFAIKKSHIVIFQNPDDRRLFEERKFVTHQQTGIVNGSGVDVSLFTLQPLPETPVFLLIARLVAEKGVREYVEAAKIVKQAIPESRFLIGGYLETGPTRITQAELDQWIESDTIEFLGKLSDARAAMAQCSIYVLPSYREGTPKTVLEAMACGRPIITCDAPGCREPVKEGVNGFLVPIKSAKNLATAMIRLGNDRVLQQKMGKESRKITENRYDIHKVNVSIIKLLEIGNEVGVATEARS